MGCGASTPATAGEPQVVEEWLASLGLQQYVQMFHAAGFDDLGTIAHLDTADLDNIAATSGTPILAGHRKKLLLAAPKLQST
eukprot:CAMPEP_0206145608 /NCGR_PEP_ID=MMETSP1473-20131121/27916_1 /ASSEMBLY_ACC=CAM_ASM_001109 /TAXON_ID=1461547 /ORGANISM="Stichococcus sp, Strain RCC1054" /LENGTH=81 /DNA_ID=CAMNT_0053541877 /DNA_START=331 /DNA_END=572 /DNA_ORIENTATION=-